jgi:uncharacterized membrane protein
MTWLQRYRVRRYVRTSIWIFPVLGAVAALGAVRFLHRIDQVMGWQWDFNPDTARMILGTMAASMFSFIVFLSSALLVAVQLASTQLTPRIIALVFQDPITKFSVTVFVMSFTLMLVVPVRITTSVPLLTAEVAAYSCLVSLAVFLHLIDHLGRSLRPSGALRSVGLRGRSVIEHVYPQRLTESLDTPPEPGSGLDGRPTGTIPNPRDGVVLAFDVQGLVAMAEHAECVIEMVPQVGDFVAAQDPLFRIFGGGVALPVEVMCQSVALGQERTLEQDPAFVFRVIVDIASKALSPTINDSTTAVLAIDQIHHLLRNVGTRRLDDGQVRDVAGRLRLVYRTPGWEDFVHLAVTENRLFGGESIQVVRRLRAMLENLIQTLPEERAPLLRQELSLLHRSAERFFPEPEDRALAAVSDLQGVGGTYGHSQRGTAAHSSPTHATHVSPEETALGKAETDTQSGHARVDRAQQAGEGGGS